MSPSESEPMRATAEYLYQYVNRYRQEHGRPTLEPDSEATSIAMDHSADQARRGELMERTMKQEPVATNVTHYGTVIDLEAKVNAQNQPPESVAQEVVNRWVNDPASERALLDPIFEHAGFGAGQGDLSVYTTAILCSDLGWLQRTKRRLTSTS
jgi:uncharacterized protein YkwD